MLHYDFMQRAFLAGGAIAMIASVLGVYLMLRGQALMADMLSHVSLAGVTAGALARGSPALAGFVVAVIGAIVAENVRRSYRSYSDVSVAIIMIGGLSTAVVLMSLNPGVGRSFSSYLFGSVEVSLAGSLGGRRRRIPLRIDAVFDDGGFGGRLRIFQAVRLRDVLGHADDSVHSEQARSLQHFALPVGPIVRTVVYRRNRRNLASPKIGDSGIHVRNRAMGVHDVGRDIAKHPLQPEHRPESPFSGPLVQFDQPDAFALKRLGKLVALNAVSRFVERDQPAFDGQAAKSADQVENDFLSPPVLQGSNHKRDFHSVGIPSIE
nr:metal ABC transporter permease [Cohnella sp. LGH]